MTKFDPSEREQDQWEGTAARKRVLLGFGGGFALVFVLGIMAGFFKATMSHGGPNGTDAMIIASMALVALAIGYLFLVPSWWMASRAGWLPDQDPMIVMVIVSFVWSGVWLVKRYL